MGLIATGAASGVSVILLALIIASAAVDIGWHLWSGRVPDRQAR